MVLKTTIARVLLVVGALSAAFAPGSARAQESDGDVEVILSIDTSESMRPAIQSAKEAANEFIASMPTDVRIGVETFADSVTVLAPPTTDRGLLDLQIALITTGGDTALYDGVVGASQRFSPDAAHKVLVILSDGKDEGSVSTIDDARLRCERAPRRGDQPRNGRPRPRQPHGARSRHAGRRSRWTCGRVSRVAGLVVEVIAAPPATAAETTTPPTTDLPATTTPDATQPIATTVTAALPPSPSSTLADQSVTEGSTVWLWVVAGGIFVGLFLLGALVFPRSRVSKARLGIDKPRTASTMGARTMSAVDEALERYGKRADLGETLASADISMQPAEFTASVGVVAIVAGTIGLLAGGPLIAIGIAGLVCVGTVLYVRRARDRRLAAFADQFPDVLQLVTPRCAAATA